MNKQIILKISALTAAVSVLLASGCSGNAASGGKYDHSLQSGESSTENTTAPDTTAPDTTASGTDAPPKKGISVSTYSPDVFVYDTTAKTFVMRSGMSQRIYPASTTKLLTALTALGVLEADTVLTAGDEIYLLKEGSSVAYILPGHKLSVEMLIEGMMLPSGNDAAYVLAAGAGRVLANDDSMTPSAAVERFVREMNTCAQKLGCRNSNFTVPDGLCGSEHYSTLEDMAKISAAAAENGFIMKYAGLVSDDVVYASGHTNHWENSNKQLHADSEYYNPNVAGLKTGSLSEYYCLITLYREPDGEEYIIGVFGSKNENERYADTREIIKALEAR